MPKVLIADELSPRAVAVFAERGIEADVAIGLKPDALAARIGAYDGLAVRSATKVTTAGRSRRHALKVVGRAGIGVDNIDVPAATQRGIVVMNTPYGNAITAAEHAIAMMFALARQIPAADRSTQAGKWESRASWASSSRARRSASSAAAISARSSPTAPGPQDEGDRLTTRSSPPSAPSPSASSGSSSTSSSRAPISSPCTRR